MRIAALLLLFIAGPTFAQSGGILSLFGCDCAPCSGTERGFSTNSPHMLPNVSPGQCFTARELAGDDLQRLARGTRVMVRVGDADMPYRLIAKAGDLVEIRDGVAHVNYVPFSQEKIVDYVSDKTPFPDGTPPKCALTSAKTETCRRFQFRERSNEGLTYRILKLSLTGTTRDGLAPQYVPDGHVFVLGDNRDNSVDSRIQSPFGLGMVSVDRITHTLDF